MTKTERNKQLVSLHYQTFWSDASDDELAAQLSDQFVDHLMPSGTPPGPQPVLEYRRLARAAFPDMAVTIDHAVAEGDEVAVHATWRGTHMLPFAGIPASGAMVEFHGMVVWRFEEDGRVAERWAVTDLSKLRKS